MSILRRLHELPPHLHRYRVIAFKRITSESISVPAAYSICCARRNQTLKPPPITIQYQPHRNKSFSEAFTQIYTNVSHSTTVSYFQNAFITFHDLTGLPWWATVIIYTIGLRLATFPLAVYAQVMKAKIQNILQNEMPKMDTNLKNEVAMARKRWNLNDKETFMLYRRSFRTQYNKMIERDNCHPLKTTMLHWFQIPIWICHSIGIRNIITIQPDPQSVKAIQTFGQLTVGGCLWLPNLIDADTSYVLPAIWCITNLINIELGALERTGPPSKLATTFTGIFRVITIVVAPIAATVPSCLTLYWCTSSICALGQNLILLSPRAKRLFGIPTNTIHHMDRPYRTLAIRFAEQMQRRKNWCTSLLKLK